MEWPSGETGETFYHVFSDLDKIENNVIDFDIKNLLNLLDQGGTQGRCNVPGKYIGITNDHTSVLSQTSVFQKKNVTLNVVIFNKINKTHVL